MDLAKVLAQLRRELANLDSAIESLERLAADRAAQGSATRVADAGQEEAGASARVRQTPGGQARVKPGAPR